MPVWQGRLGVQHLRVAELCHSSLTNQPVGQHNRCLILPSSFSIRCPHLLMKSTTLTCAWQPPQTHCTWTFDAHTRRQKTVHPSLRRTSGLKLQTPITGPPTDEAAECVVTSCEPAPSPPRTCPPGP